MVKLLRQFLAATSKRAPERVIFLRDGISEGQFSKVAFTASATTTVVCHCLPSHTMLFHP